MRKVIFITVIWSFMMQACQPKMVATNELEKLKEDLAMAQEKIESLEANDSKKQLVHIVMLDLKNDLLAENRAKLNQAILDLRQIDEVQDLEIGVFADLKDKRALSDFELAFQMSFSDKAAYQSYQTHPIHLQLKAIAKNYLDAPPTTYDYIQQ